MRIFLTGATGLIGQALVYALLAEKYQIVAFVRDHSRAKKIFPNVSPESLQFVTRLEDYLTLDGFDGVINLAGEPILAKRWTAIQKQKIRESRINLTQKISELINFSQNRPRFFISGSATGYYGDRGDDEIHENAQPAHNFAAILCQQWENAAIKANTRVCLLRTGVVLSTKGGILAKILPFYKLGLGGQLGNGKAFLPWIALEDMVRAILFLTQNEKCQGVFNLTAPTPISNQDFNQQLARKLKRPACCRIPQYALQLVLGERATLLLQSQNAKPSRLQEQGFSFIYPDLEKFLKEVL